MLHILEGGSWSIICTIRTGNAKVYSGWKAFVLENKVIVDDVCVFELIKGAQLCVNIKIFCAAGSTLMYDIVTKVPGVYDSKRKVIKVNNYIPSSQPKVVRIKELRHQARGSSGLNSKTKGDKVKFS